MRHHINPLYFECPPDLPEMFREAEAALLIGDDALRVFAKPGRFYIYDLGEEWKKLSGEKMVYAVWVVQKAYAKKYPALVSKVFHAFQLSLHMSLKHLDEIAEDIAQWETFSKRFLKNYFKSLRFNFDKGYQQGLITYLKMAQGIGAIDRIPPLRFVEIMET